MAAMTKLSVPFILRDILNALLETGTGIIRVCVYIYIYISRTFLHYILYEITIV
jgi:hypothetical protein